jgi:hypothetical protein
MEISMSQRKYKRALQGNKKNSPEVQPSPEHPPAIQALVWYREEDWDVLKNMFADGEMLPKTYGDWLKRALEMQEKVQAAGDAVVKVTIDPETFPQWCEKKGLPMDAEARSQLAIEAVQAQSLSL